MGEDPDLEILSKPESIRLLTTATVGRVVFTDMSLPGVHPVTFVMDGEEVIFRTRDGSTFASAVNDRIVAFEVDELDAKHQRGWWVTVIGPAKTITDPAEIARLTSLPLLPWGPGEKQHFASIRIEIIEGRRLGPARGG
jgi:uncharacterized protein